MTSDLDVWRVGSPLQVKVACQSSTSKNKNVSIVVDATLSQNLSSLVKLLVTVIILQTI